LKRPDRAKALQLLDYVVASIGTVPYDWRVPLHGGRDFQSPFSIPLARDSQLPPPMNKADLVNLVAARTELTKTDVSQVVDAAIETIIDSVVEGKKVSILGFGSFESRERSARQGLNPKTGEKIAIPAKKVPAFTAGKLFKDRVQG
jgi:DNA-binding protein HU-beta